MKTRVIPAQVTTVEDKIAGNLNFTQILLLIASVIISTGIYATLPEPMKFNLYKFLLIVSVFIIFGTLSLRLKERVVLNWLVLLLTYSLRPNLYIFDKNTTYLRLTREINAKKTKGTKTKKEIKEHHNNANVNKLTNVDYNKIARDTNVSIRFDKKGAVGVKNI